MIVLTLHGLSLNGSKLSGRGVSGVVITLAAIVVSRKIRKFTQIVVVVAIVVVRKPSVLVLVVVLVVLCLLDVPAVLVLVVGFEPARFLHPRPGRHPHHRQPLSLGLRPFRLLLNQSPHPNKLLLRLAHHRQL